MSHNQSWQRGTRWYYCHIEQDLFGNWVVRRVWGDRVSRRSGSKEHLCQSLEEAQKVFEYVAKRRKWRKYEVVSTGQALN
ncbi:MAG: WGR domain-containing protein [Microcystaceae cyanobacterium]